MALDIRQIQVELFTFLVSKYTTVNTIYISVTYRGKMHFVHIDVSDENRRNCNQHMIVNRIFVTNESISSYFTLPACLYGQLWFGTYW